MIQQEEFDDLVSQAGIAFALREHNNTSLGNDGLIHKTGAAELVTFDNVTSFSIDVTDLRQVEPIITCARTVLRHYAQI